MPTKDRQKRYRERQRKAASAVHEDNSHVNSMTTVLDEITSVNIYNLHETKKIYLISLPP